MTINAYDELIEKLNEIGKSLDDIKVISIRFNKYNREKHYEFEYIKKIDNVNDLKEIQYYDGYGIQELYGYVVFNDNTWLEREEYDGSEWWEYRSIYKILEIIGSGKK